MSPLLLPSSEGHSKHHRTAQFGREQDQVPLPWLADPAAVALAGTFVLFGVLALPGFLIFVLIVLIVRSFAGRLTVRRKPRVDRALAARFRKLENTILGANAGWSGDQSGGHA